MPFSIKRPNLDNPKVKEWKSHDLYKTGYVEITKFKTKERAAEVAAEWGGDTEIVEVPWGAGEEPDEYPNF